MIDNSNSNLESNMTILDSLSSMLFKIIGTDDSSNFNAIPALVEYPTVTFKIMTMVTLVSNDANPDLSSPLRESKSKACALSIARIIDGLNV